MADSDHGFIWSHRNVLLVHNSLDGFNFSGYRGHVKVGAEDEALQVGEVVVLHQPGDGPDLGQGEGHELGVR